LLPPELKRKFKILKLLNKLKQRRPYNLFPPSILQSILEAFSTLPKIEEFKRYITFRRILDEMYMHWRVITRRMWKYS